MGGGKVWRCLTKNLREAGVVASRKSLRETGGAVGGGSCSCAFLWWARWRTGSKWRCTRWWRCARSPWGC